MIEQNKGLVVQAIVDFPGCFPDASVMRKVSSSRCRPS
jgi:hypothetical protein